MAFSRLKKKKNETGLIRMIDHLIKKKLDTQSKPIVHNNTLKNINFNLKTGFCPAWFGHNSIVALERCRSAAALELPRCLAVRPTARVL